MRPRAVLLLGTALLLAGCSSVPLIAGVVGGGVAGGATANPVVGFGVGVGIDAATDAGLKWVGRARQHAEQNAIAERAGTLPVGDRTDWHISHFLPFGNEGGELQVVRQLDTPLAPCREIAFSVVEAPGPPHWYTASICRQANGWRWASAEPTVARWGYLQ